MVREEVPKSTLPNGRRPTAAQSPERESISGQVGEHSKKLEGKVRGPPLGNEKRNGRKRVEGQTIPVKGTPCEQELLIKLDVDSKESPRNTILQKKNPKEGKSYCRSNECFKEKHSSKGKTFG